MVSVLRRTDLGFDIMLRLLDGIILASIFFMFIFFVLFGLGLNSKIEELKEETVRIRQRISDLNRRIKWMRDEL